VHESLMNIGNFMKEDKVYANKFHNFMVYEAVKRILTTKELESKINCLIEKAHLTKEKNPFFIKAKQTTNLSLESALKIAFNWREIIKQFMVTVLINLGELADKVNQLDFPSEYAISALKTGITIISEDLNNVFTEYEEKASIDPDGMHYVWWEKSILKPLLAATNNKKLSSKIKSSPKTQQLLQEMNKLATHPLGFAVQLYVVEIIALDMVLAFLPLFASIEVDGQKIFKSSEIISWIMEHIQDESIPQGRALHEDNELINSMSTIKDRNDLFLLAQNYIECWSETLMEFGELLNRQHIDYYNQFSIADEKRILQ